MWSKESSFPHDTLFPYLYLFSVAFDQPFVIKSTNKTLDPFRVPISVSMDSKYSQTMLHRRAWSKSFCQGGCRTFEQVYSCTNWSKFFARSLSTNYVHERLFVENFLPSKLQRSLSFKYKFKYNPGKINKTNLSTVSLTISVYSDIIPTKFKKRATNCICMYGSGHSLRSANQFASASN